MNARSRFAKGQIVALFTIILPVLLGVMALGADFSIIYFNWAMVQKAADAAALAGASQLTGVSGSAGTVQPAVVNYVNGYACMNGVSDPNNSSTTPVACTPATHPGGFTDQIAFTNVTDTQVSVGIKRTVPYFFGKLIGLNTAGVAAKATAAILATGTAPAFPVGLQCTPNASGKCDLSALLKAFGPNVTFGSKFVLNDSNNNMQSSGGAPGNWDWIDVGQGQGASGLGSVLAGGVTETLNLGQTISTSPGIGKGNSKPAQDGLDKRLASCSAVTDPCTNGGKLPTGFNCKDPCLISVPVMDFTNCNGNCSRKIEGFALMYLEQGSTTSAINACYINGSSCTGDGSVGAPNLGSLAPPLLIN
ncbi:MAG TPA: pilus assembly protein TadG-related protein [Candidatus Binataceae bacterium]|jgi:Flp pilus assembly protein TadG|nr:pilus assembly protein TadG-related protein [Candidatus Binataceae bacterium]